MRKDDIAASAHGAPDILENLRAVGVLENQCSVERTELTIMAPQPGDFHDVACVGVLVAAQPQNARRAKTASSDFIILLVPIDILHPKIIARSTLRRRWKFVLHHLVTNDLGIARRGHAYSL